VHTNFPPDALPIVTNTDTSTVVPKQTCSIKPITNKRGEKNSRWLHDNVVYFESVNINNKPFCDNATDAINFANVALPCAKFTFSSFQFICISIPTGCSYKWAPTQ
jgi:hypothetical protein